MADRDAPSLEKLADLLIFAPLGLALEARRLWPDLAERGRRQLNKTRETGSQVLGGPYAWVDRRLGRAREEADTALRGLGLALAPERTDEEVSQPIGDPSPASPVIRLSVPQPASSPTSQPGLAVSDLAIPDYDSLSASQVVPRLVALEPGELELIRRYESASRGRKTILNRIAQLQAG